MKKILQYFFNKESIIDIEDCRKEVSEMSRDNNKNNGRQNISDYTVQSFKDIGVRVSDGNPWRQKNKDAILPMKSHRDKVELKFK